MVKVLRATHYQVRIMSQMTAPADLDSNLEGTTADIITGTKVIEALADVDIVGS
jgi:hypothetical protein